MKWLCLRTFLSEDRAATAAEYAIMLALIIGAAISAISAFGGSTSTGWSRNVSAITQAINAAGS
jgi:Flp pilus assembly pilin Flp